MINFRDQLKVEGVNARGYGTVPKMVMLDRKLTIEAKAIYSYFCSYAGAGLQAFPGTRKIQEDLKISKDRYYRHFDLLKNLGYIKVEQIRNEIGKFKHNIYTLVTNPEPVPEEKQPVDNSNEKSHKTSKIPCPQNNDTDKNQLNTASRPCPQNPDTDKPYTQNKDINTNTLYNINNSLYNQSFSLLAGNERMKKTKNNTDELNFILDKAEINEQYLKENYPAVKRAVESLYFRNKSLEVNNITLPTKQIREDLKKLNQFHVDMGLRIFHEQSAEQVIRNKIGYLAICIYNSIFDMELKITNDLRINGII